MTSRSGTCLVALNRRLKDLVGQTYRFCSSLLKCSIMSCSPAYQCKIVRFKKKHLLITPSFKSDIIKFSIACRILDGILLDLFPRISSSLGRSLIKMMHESNKIKEMDFSFGHLLFSVLVVYC